MSPTRDDGKQYSMLSVFAGGAGSGFFCDIIMHPIDSVRARLQSMGSFVTRYAPKDPVQRAAWSKKWVYSGTRDTIKKMIINEGPTSLYQGMGVVMLLTIPAHALYFTGYEVTKRMLYPTRRVEDKPWWVFLVGGGVAELSGSMLWTPMEVFKQRIMVQRHPLPETVQYRSFSHALKTVMQQEGVRGLFVGYGACLATFVPFVTVYFGAYEQFRRIAIKLQGKLQVDDLSFTSTLICGAMGGAFSAAITSPIDMIRTRLQISSHGSLERSIIQGMKNAWKSEGIHLFTRGMGVRMLMSAPGTAITQSTYEWCKHHFSYLEDSVKKQTWHSV